MTTKFKPAGYDPYTDTPRFNVAPRYTPGSPALVRRAIALHVARSEKDMYQEALDLGGQHAEQARRLGLSGIVEERWELYDVRRFRDLLTGEIGIYNEKGEREVTGKLSVEM